MESAGSYFMCIFGEKFWYFRILLLPLHDKIILISKPINNKTKWKITKTTMKKSSS